MFHFFSNPHRDPVDSMRPGLNLKYLIMLPCFFMGFTLLFLKFANTDYKSPILYFGLCILLINIFSHGKFHYRISHRLFILFFSIAFSALLILKSHIVFTGNLHDPLTRNYFSSLGAGDIFYFLLCSIVVFLTLIYAIPLLFAAAKKIPLAEAKAPASNWRHIAVLTASLLIPWFVVYLAFWPGSTMWNDIWAILRHGPVTESYRSPLFFNYAVYFFLVKVGDFIGNRNFGFALFTFLQMFFMALAIATVLYWMKRRKIHKRLIICAWLFYLCFPAFSLFSFTIVKDVWYSICLFLWIPLLYDLVQGHSLSLKYKIAYIALIIGTLISRNNGPIIIPFVIFLTILIVKNHRRFLLLAALISFLVVVGTTALLSRNTSRRFAESVGIPLQQTAMVLSCDGQVSYADKKFLYQIINPSDWTGRYAPFIVDPLKMTEDDPTAINTVLNDDFLNHHQKQFLQVYFRIFKNNPKLCIKAYLLESYGFWAFHSVHGNQSYLTVLQENEFGFYRSPKLPRPLVRPATHYYKYIGNSIGSAGTFAWLLLSFCLLLLILPKGKKYILIVSPMLLNGLTIMISVPIAFAFRYVLYYLFALPMLLVLFPLIVQTADKPCRGAQ
ncbi:DUF6020 family protein [Pseudoramibacter alactolyticus]|uniref:DUF6020 family protein n=1 Tax=Pseudoramibacter alactolyticus TaxID=113287 RepID=UPI0023573F75|nr:DUF6020 family protein [Pseudoramibacter alactolyticus]MBM6967936.1 hypothetical protein [Pseudoramibacter alactolyticus]